MIPDPKGRVSAKWEPVFGEGSCSNQKARSRAAMAIDETPSSFFAPWPDRLRHSAIILLAAGLALSMLVAFGELALARAGAVFICIAAAALVPWRLHDAVASREDVRGVNPVEAAAVSAVVAGMPDPA